jgi:SAM-dependent methyltransferase
MVEQSAPDSVTGNLVGAIHDRFIFGRRTVVLADHLASLIPNAARVLDVGCGDGTIDRLIMAQRPDVSIEGIDPLVRPKTHIPVREFNGLTLPYPDSSFEVVMFVDVLHHANDPRVLLREAARGGRSILIKDHNRQGFLGKETLRLMDWVGNARHGVTLPYNYWSKSEWMAAFNEIGFRPRVMKLALGLYPIPMTWVFDRGLHFIARCEHA